MGPHAPLKSVAIANRDLIRGTDMEFFQAMKIVGYDMELRIS